MADKINLVIAGFQKAGTTSIKEYLNQSSSVLSHAQMEMTYFSVQEEFDKGEKDAVKRYYNNEPFVNYKYVLAKHATLIRHEASIKRLYDYNPEAKIIVCLRDPIERAYSSYLMEHSNGSVKQSFDEVVKQSFENFENQVNDWRYNVFIKLGQYADFVKVLMKYFPSDQLHFIRIEKFKSDPQNVVNVLFKWLGLKLKDNNYQIKYNSFRGQRSLILGKLINSVLSERGFVKKRIKPLIPIRFAASIGKKIRAVNKKKMDKPKLSESTETFLKNHYKRYNEALDKLISQ